MPAAVYRAITDDLRARILEGTLAAGHPLPSEAELAATWRTSRGPVRNALAALRSEGLIETSRGRSTRVAMPLAHQPVDVFLPFTRWAREFGREPGAVTREVIRRRARQEAAALGIDPDDDVVTVLRLRLLDGVPTMVEHLTFIDEVGRLLFSADLDVVSITDYLAERGIVHAFVEHEIRAIPADEIDADLLEVPVGSPLLRLRRVTRSQDGRVFEVSEDRYHADHVAFSTGAGGTTHAAGLSRVPVLSDAQNSGSQV